MNRGADYWRSDRGADEYRQMLDTRYEQFRARASRKKTWKGSSFDLIALSDFPNPGMTFHSTFGMSEFVLSSEDDGIRQELAWTTLGSEPLEYVENVLLNLGMITLDNKAPLLGGETLTQYPLATHLPPEMTVSTILTHAGLWLDESEYLIEGHFPAFILELVGLTDSEVALFKDDQDEFYRRCEAGVIDVLNLQRPQLEPSAI